MCLATLDRFHIISNLPDHCKGLAQIGIGSTPPLQSPPVTNLGKNLNRAYFTVEW